jgi:hypothetical protein
MITGFESITVVTEVFIEPEKDRQNKEGVKSNLKHPLQNIVGKTENEADNHYIIILKYMFVAVHFTKAFCIKESY